MPTLRLWPEAPAAGGVAPRRVLIVDESPENREVLRTALERRGLEILEAPEVGRGLDLARRYHPDVIVLDADSTADDDGSQRRACASTAAQDHSSLVVLGQWPKDWPEERSDARRRETPRSEMAQPRIVRKPYHFEPLVKLIEDLSTRRRAA